MVPILLETNPYSFEKRKYGGISGSGHAACILSIRIRILSESNFFRGMEYPMSGHVIETPRVKTCKRPYFSTHAECYGVSSMKKFYSNPSSKKVCFLLSINFHGTDGIILIYLQNVNVMWRFHAVKCHEIPWYVKIPVFSLDWNSTVHEIPAFWQHRNSTVHEISNA